MKKIWLFSYSTAVARLLETTYALQFVKDENSRPYEWGPWEFDTSDGTPELNQRQLEAFRAEAAKSHLPEQGKRKKAIEAALPPKQSPAEDEDDEEHDEEFRAIAAAEARDADRNGPPVEADDGVFDTNSTLAKRMPKGLKEKLWADYVASGKPTTYIDEKTGKEISMKPKYVKCYRMMAFADGFRVDHMICDEAHLLRNASTRWSRLIRRIIKLAQPDVETNPATLVLVSATPAINDISDYRGLSSLF